MANKTDTLIQPNIALEVPPMYKVLYLNDNVTTMDFVIASLIEFFNYTEETAVAICTGIHEEGSAVVAVLPFEIAEQKGVEVTVAARSAGFPLQVKVEEDED